MNGSYLHPQLRNTHPSFLAHQSISILPNRILELRRADLDLVKNDAVRGRDGLYSDMNPRIQAKYQARVRPIKHQVATSQQHFAWRRHGYGIANHHWK